MAAQAWRREIAPPEGMALIDLSQAAPALPPPRPLRRAMARAVLEDPSVHLYGAVPGLPALREALAERMRGIYGGAVRPDEVAITSGCNQAFAAAIASLAGPGDAVILPCPWYFNHKMWLDMSGIEAVPCPVGPAMLPDPDEAEALVGPRTRAIVLVTPNNPCGTEYPPELLDAFAALARRRRLMLVVDETYRDFRAAPGAPHRLFSDPDWSNVLIHLYSFSKAYRLTGHRVGAIATSPERLRQVEKFLDTVTICPTGLGQVAALWGLTHLGDWLEGERAEILARRRAMAEGIAGLEGWSLEGCGAFFAWVRPPGGGCGAALAKALLAEAGLLCLPGAMFAPPGHRAGAGALRLAFANVDREGIAEVLRRLGR